MTKIYTIAEAAEITQTSTQTIYSLIKAKRVDVYQRDIGCAYKLTPRSIQQILGNHQPAIPPFDQHLAECRAGGTSPAGGRSANNKRNKFRDV